MDDSADRRQGNAAPRRLRPGGGRLAGWATRLVLGLAAVAGGTILVLTTGPRFLPYQTYVVVSGQRDQLAARRRTLIRLHEAGADERREMVSDCLSKKYGPR